VVVRRNFEAKVEIEMEAVEEGSELVAEEARIRSHNLKD
jgi:hypothetical protein